MRANPMRGQPRPSLKSPQLLFKEQAVQFIRQFGMQRNVALHTGKNAVDLIYIHCFLLLSSDL